MEKYYLNEKAIDPVWMDQKAQEHLPALSGTDQLIPATDFL